jgi:hypothetical protein
VAIAIRGVGELELDERLGRRLVEAWSVRQ